MATRQMELGPDDEPKAGEGAGKKVVGPSGPWRALSERQLLAAHLLVQGETIASAAAHLSVNRTTIWRWTTKDPQFIRYQSHLRAERYRAWRDRMEAVSERAATVVMDKLEEGDATVAVAMTRIFASFVHEPRW
jgi:hypothetical protein